MVFISTLLSWLSPSGIYIPSSIFFFYFQQNYLIFILVIVKRDFSFWWKEARMKKRIHLNSMEETPEMK